MEDAGGVEGKEGEIELGEHREYRMEDVYGQGVVTEIVHEIPDARGEDIMTPYEEGYGKKRQQQT